MKLVPVSCRDKSFDIATELLKKSVHRYFPLLVSKLIPPRRYGKTSWRGSQPTSPFDARLKTSFKQIRPAGALLGLVQIWHITGPDEMMVGTTRPDASVTLE